MSLRLTPAELRKVKDRLKACTRELETAVKPRKYRNVPTEVDGVRFDSKREAKRWKELRLRLRKGEIPWLARQAEFHLPGGVIYRCDFVYPAADPLVGPGIVIEDAKGVRTAAYRIKKRLMASLGWHITEV